MSTSTNKKVIIIAGPTAVGKTAAAIAVAQHFKAEIISADSRQCFRELTIGVARPSLSELAAVPHHFIASHSIHDEVTAATFEQYALAKVDTLFQQYDTVVMTGGTGLYIKAFCEGLDAIPEIPAAIRQSIIEGFDKNGLQWLQEEITRKDPQYAGEGEMRNPQRIMRALEVINATGQSILHFRKGNKTQRPFTIIKTALELPRHVLYEHINHRVIAMMQAGLLDEVRSLQPFQHLNALQTVGYSELFDHLGGKTSEARAVELIQQHTRNYAKRQMTWFKRDTAFHWFAPNAMQPLINFVHEATGS